MEKLKMQSLDVIGSNTQKIAQLFPNCVTERLGKDGKPELAIDFEKLQAELSNEVITEGEERYQFTWPDKRAAIRLANTPTTMTLRPCREESVDFDNTQNLYIEGDNLDVLKVLRETYLGKVKMIYIDPPYNTGNDFVYNDDFAQGKDDFEQSSGFFDEEGNQTIDPMQRNTESNGRFHTDWLNMIYPRLKVAKDLLTDDGVIFISIGEHEIDNLKKVVSEIFGVHNNIETYIWESTFRPDNSSKIMRRNAEYVVCFAKDITKITELIGETKNKEGLPSLTKASMKEKILTFPQNTVITYLDDGIYKAGVRDSYELLDDVTVKDGKIVNSFRLKGRVIWGQENLEKEIKLGTQIIIKGDGFVPYTKKNGESVMSPTKLIPNNLVGDILSSNAEMAKLFSEKVFSYPKPITLIEYFIHYFDDKDFIVLDFFSGSSTTAHAVMNQNIKDNGTRKFIMVQLAEDLDDNYSKASDKEKVIIKNAIELCDSINAPHILTEVAKERIRRAGKKIKEENASKEGIERLDTGFRVLKLDTSNMEDVYYTPQEFESQSLFNENVKADRTNEDLLFQVMLDLGIELSAKIESKQIAGKNVHFVDDNYLVACFDRDVNESTITEIAKLQPIYFVMRDASASNDNVIDNFEQIFKHYSPDTNCKII